MKESRHCFAPAKRPSRYTRCSFLFLRNEIHRNSITRSEQSGNVCQVAAKLPSWTVDSKPDNAKVALTAGAAWAAIVLGAGAADLSAGEEVFTNNCGA